MPEPNETLRAVVFCPGPMGIYEQAIALQERKKLGMVATDLFVRLDRFPFRMSRGKLRSMLSRRSNPELDVSRVRLRLLPSILTHLGSRLARTRAGRDRWVFLHNRMFDRWVARNIRRWGTLAFGYESSSLITFQEAAKANMPRVLYQPIVCAEFATKILKEEAERFPQFADTLRYSWFPPAEIERRKEERRLADAIVCASSFTKQSLVSVGVAPDKIFVQPYGVDQEIFRPSSEKFPRFSIIWASALTQSKGILYLLDALARYGRSAELVVAGYPFGRNPLDEYRDRVSIRFLGKVSRAHLAEVMARCHVHVFPTLVEGFGRNIIEAMASGLPVIASPHCAGPDLIEDGETGFIVPIRDPDAILERLSWIESHPREAEEMGLRAREHVRTLTRADYRRRFADTIERVWENSRTRGIGRES